MDLAIGDACEFLSDRDGWTACRVTRRRLDRTYDVFAPATGERQHCVPRRRLRTAKQETEKPAKLAVGSRVRRGDDTGRVLNARRDGALDVAWKGGAVDVAVGAATLSPERREDDDDGGGDDDLSSSDGAGLDTGSRVSVRYAAGAEYAGTVVKAASRKRGRAPVVAAGAAPGCRVRHRFRETQRAAVYDVRFDDGGEERDVAAARVRPLSPASDPRPASDADDSDVDGDESLHARWCARRSGARTARGTTPASPAAPPRPPRRGDRVKALVALRGSDARLWRDGNVVRDLPRERRVVVAFDADVGPARLVDAADVRPFDEAGAKSPGKEVSRAGVRPEDLTVGTVVRAPFKGSSRTYAARVTRCRLEGTVDLVFLDRDGRDGPGGGERLVRVDPDALEARAAAGDDDAPEPRAAWAVGDAADVVGGGARDRCRVTKVHRNGHCSALDPTNGRVRVVPETRLEKPLDSPAARRKVEGAVVDRARRALASYVAGAPGGARGAFGPLSLDGVVDAATLAELLERAGFVANDAEVAAVRRRARKYGDGDEAEDALSLDALCAFATGDGSEDLAGERVRRAAVALRRELVRCAARDGGPPDARALFREVDADGAGFVDVSKLLGRLGARLSKKSRGDLEKLLDVDGDGRVDVDEFVDFVRLGVPSPKKDARDALQKVVYDELSALSRRASRRGTRKRGQAPSFEDAAADGGVDAEALRETLASRGWGDLFADGSRPARVISALDADGDGVVDAEELAAFAERGGASVDDERRALRRLRRGLARWLDSPCAALQLRSVVANGGRGAGGDADGVAARLPAAARAAFLGARRDLSALGVGLNDDDLDLAALAFARRRNPLAATVAAFANETAKFFVRARSAKGGFKALGSHGALARVLEAVNALPKGWARKAAVSTARWDSHCVPALRKAGLNPSDCAALAAALTTRGDVDVGRLEQLADDEPLARALERPRRRPKTAARAPPEALAVGDRVDVAAAAARRFFKATAAVPGAVVGLRPNGRVDVRPDDPTAPALRGLRRVDVAYRGAPDAAPPRPRPAVAACAAPPDARRLGGGAAGPAVPDAAPPRPNTRRYIAPTSTLKLE